MVGNLSCAIADLAAVASMKAANNVMARAPADFLTSISLFLQANQAEARPWAFTLACPRARDQLGVNRGRGPAQGGGDGGGIGPAIGFRRICIVSHG
jgi:hypothetical protein